MRRSPSRRRPLRRRRLPPPAALLPFQRPPRLKMPPSGRRVSKCAAPLLRRRHLLPRRRPPLPPRPVEALAALVVPAPPAAAGILSAWRVPAGTSPCRACRSAAQAANPPPHAPWLQAVRDMAHATASLAGWAVSPPRGPRGPLADQSAFVGPRRPRARRPRPNRCSA